ncbi:MAG: lysoplasmalogenase family protein [Pseudomonadota bacterium]
MNPAHRLIFVAALIAGISYYFADAVTTDGVVHLIWKGSGVGLLALWAAIRARSFDGWLLSAVLTLGAIADVVIEAAGTVAGGAIFFAGHLVAVWLYLRNRRAASSEDYMIAALMLIAIPLAAWLLPDDRAAAGQIALYAAGLGAMAAAALLSDFPRDRIALGAALFVASDLLIFARLGPLATSPLPDILVWPLYFAGQALIAHGVARSLEART